MKICLTIASSDCISGAGIQEDLKVFSALGVYGTSVVSAVTAQNTLGVFGVRVLDLDIVEKQIDAVLDLCPNEVKVGLLGSSEISDLVFLKMKEYGLSPVFDPVIRSTTGFDFMDDSVVESLRKLCNISKIVTPNKFEAEILSGIKIKNFDDMKKAAEIIGKCVVIKDEGVDFFYQDGKIEILRAEKIPFKTHGSGCTFSSAITAYLAKGYTIKDSVKKAKIFTYEAIKNALFKKPVKILNPFYEVERNKIKESIENALEILNTCSNLREIYPEVGMNIAEAMNHAYSLDGVAEFSGRIVYDYSQKKLFPVGKVMFGMDKHLSRALLSYIKYSKTNNRGLINIAFSEKVLEKFKERFKVSEFDRSKEEKEEEKEKSTMEWGIKEALKKNPYAEIIYDRGGFGKEAMIRVFGVNAVDSANKILRIMAYQE